MRLLANAKTKHISCSWLQPASRSYKHRQCHCTKYLYLISWLFSFSPPGDVNWTVNWYHKGAVEKRVSKTFSRFQFLLAQMLMLLDVTLHQLFNLRRVDLAISAVTYLQQNDWKAFPREWFGYDGPDLWNSLPEDLLVGFLVDLPGIVSWLQHQLYFFHNTLLALNFLQELRKSELMPKYQILNTESVMPKYLLLDCHFHCRAGHIVYDLQLVIDHLRLHLLGWSS